LNSRGKAARGKRGEAVGKNFRKTKRETKALNLQRKNAHNHDACDREGTLAHHVVVSGGEVDRGGKKTADPFQGGEGIKELMGTTT